MRDSRRPCCVPGWQPPSVAAASKPRGKLVGFRGTIQTDAYEVYRALKRKNPALKRNGCLAHSRRKFYQALEESLTEAAWFIERIRELYQIEDQVRALPPARSPGRAPRTSASDLGNFAETSPRTPTKTFAQQHAGQSHAILSERIPGPHRISARWSLRDRQQSGGECHPASGLWVEGDGCSLAIPRPDGAAR